MSQDLTNNELKRFNYCRLFVGAMYLSEICKAEGSALVPGISKGETECKEYTMSLRKPRQQKPDKKLWKVWTKVLACITMRGNTHNERQHTEIRFGRMDGSTQRCGNVEVILCHRY